MRPRQGRPKLLQAMLDAFSLPDLRRKILITAGILIIFRFIAHVPLPGVDLDALGALFERNALLGMLDLFSGGAMRRLSVAAMGVYPYITASIIMMLLVPVIPRLQALSREGESGRNRINLITHWLVIPLAAVSGYGQLVYLQREGVVSSVGVLPMIAMVASMVAGTILLVWMGEMITEYGIGNGISIIIFGGIVAGLPTMISQGFLARDNIGGLFVYILMVVLTIAVIVVFTEAHRRIPVQYAKSVFRSGRMYRQSGSTHIPLRVNSSGMIPLIFAMSLVIFPGIVASYFSNPMQPNFANTIMQVFSPNAPLPLGLFYWGLYFLLAMGFTFFYTMVVFQQQDLPNTLQRQGGFIPGIRPGKNTATYLNGVINRITWGGALFLASIAVMPFVVRTITNIEVIQLSSLGLLIMVGVVLDTMKQLEAQLVMRRYEGFIK
ncbi:MAG: preprotein translocase subunit SecY [Chloroflexi bacterium]|nr:preprotein translocase subunit SecY [Chloroflexota bacterium]